MTRTEYLAAIIGWYLTAPDTPAKPSRSDWAIATTLWHRRIPVEAAQLAIELASVRRHLRPLEIEPLEPIRSLGYFRPLAIQLAQQPPQQGYVEHIRHHYRRLTAITAAKPRDSSAS